MPTPQYGIYGYVLDPENKPLHPDTVTVTCSCGGSGAQWGSGGNEPDGYWEIEFSETEANNHNNHGMEAVSDCWGDSTDFTFVAPVTGPVNIICET